MPLSLRAYAERRGVSAEAVSQAVKRGRLSASIVRVGGRPKIRDPDLADREWAESTRPDMVPISGPAARRGRDGEPSALVQGRTRLETAKAELIEMQLRERKGELVQAAEVERRWASIISACKAQLLAIPSRLKQEDPDLTTAQIALVEKLVREALIDLATSRGTAGRRSAR